MSRKFPNNIFIPVITFNLTSLQLFILRCLHSLVQISENTSNYVKINPRWLSFGIFMLPPPLKFILYSRHWTLNKFHCSPENDSRNIYIEHALSSEAGAKNKKKLQKELRINFVGNRLHVHCRHSVVCMSEIKARKKFKLLCSHLDLFSEKDYKAFFPSSCYTCLFRTATVLESTKVTVSCILTEWEWASIVLDIFFCNLETVLCTLREKIA